MGITLRRRVRVGDGGDELSCEDKIGVGWDKLVRDGFG